MLFKSWTDAKQEEKKELEKQKQEEYEKLRIACKEIFKGNNGLYFLNFLKNTCLWDSQNTNIDDGILKYHKGRRDVWLIIRALIPKDVLTRVEIYNGK